MVLRDGLRLKRGDEESYKGTQSRGLLQCPETESDEPLEEVSDAGSGSTAAPERLATKKSRGESDAAESLGALLEEDTAAVGHYGISPTCCSLLEDLRGRTTDLNAGLDALIYSLLQQQQRQGGILHEDNSPHSAVDEQGTRRGGSTVASSSPGDLVYKRNEKQRDGESTVRRQLRQQQSSEVQRLQETRLRERARADLQVVKLQTQIQQLQQENQLLLQTVKEKEDSLRKAQEHTRAVQQLYRRSEASGGTSSGTSALYVPLLSPIPRQVPFTGLRRRVINGRVETDEGSTHKPTNAGAAGVDSPLSPGAAAARSGLSDLTRVSQRLAENVFVDEAAGRDAVYREREQRLLPLSANLYYSRDRKFLLGFNADARGVKQDLAPADILKDEFEAHIRAMRHLDFGLKNVPALKDWMTVFVSAWKLMQARIKSVMIPEKPTEKTLQLIKEKLEREKAALFMALTQTQQESIRVMKQVFRQLWRAHELEKENEKQTSAIVALRQDLQKTQETGSFLSETAKRLESDLQLAEADCHNMREMLGLSSSDGEVRWEQLHETRELLRKASEEAQRDEAAHASIAKHFQETKLQLEKVVAEYYTLEKHAENMESLLLEKSAECEAHEEELRRVSAENDLMTQELGMTKKKLAETAGALQEKLRATSAQQLQAADNVQRVLRLLEDIRLQLRTRRASFFVKVSHGTLLSHKKNAIFRRQTRLNRLLQLRLGHPKKHISSSKTTSRISKGVRSKIVHRNVRVTLSRQVAGAAGERSTSNLPHQQTSCIKDTDEGGDVNEAVQPLAANADALMLLENSGSLTALESTWQSIMQSLLRVEKHYSAINPASAKNRFSRHFQDLEHVISIVSGKASQARRTVQMLCCPGIVTNMQTESPVQEKPSEGFSEQRITSSQTSEVPLKKKTSAYERYKEKGLARKRLFYYEDLLSNLTLQDRKSSSEISPRCRFGNAVPDNTDESIEDNRKDRITQLNRICRAQSDVIPSLDKSSESSRAKSSISSEQPCSGREKTDNTENRAYFSSKTTRKAKQLVCRDGLPERDRSNRVVFPARSASWGPLGRRFRLLPDERSRSSEEDNSRSYQSKSDQSEKVRRSRIQHRRAGALPHVHSNSLNSKKSFMSFSEEQKRYRLPKSSVAGGCRLLRRRLKGKTAGLKEWMKQQSKGAPRGSVDSDTMVASGTHVPKKAADFIQSRRVRRRPNHSSKTLEDLEGELERAKEVIAEIEMTLLLPTDFFSKLRTLTEQNIQLRLQLVSLKTELQQKNDEVTELKLLQVTAYDHAKFQAETERRIEEFEKQIKANVAKTVKHHHPDGDASSQAVMARQQLQAAQREHDLELRTVRDMAALELERMRQTHDRELSQMQIALQAVEEQKQAEINKRVLLVKLQQEAAAERLRCEYEAKVQTMRQQQDKELLELQHDKAEALHRADLAHEAAVTEMRQVFRDKTAKLEKSWENRLLKYEVETVKEREDIIKRFREKIERLEEALKQQQDEAVRMHELSEQQQQGSERCIAELERRLRAEALEKTDLHAQLERQTAILESVEEKRPAVFQKRLLSVKSGASEGGCWFEVGEKNMRADRSCQAKPTSRSRGVQVDDAVFDYLHECTDIAREAASAAMAEVVKKNFSRTVSPGSEGYGEECAVLSRKDISLAAPLAALRTEGFCKGAPPSTRNASDNVNEYQNSGALQCITAEKRSVGCDSISFYEGDDRIKLSMTNHSSDKRQKQRRRFPIRDINFSTGETSNAAKLQKQTLSENRFLLERWCSQDDDGDSSNDAHDPQTYPENLFRRVADVAARAKLSSGLCRSEQDNKTNLSRTQMPRISNTVGKTSPEHNVIKHAAHEDYTKSGENTQRPRYYRVRSAIQQRSSCNPNSCEKATLAEERERLIFSGSMPGVKKLSSKDCTDGSGSARKAAKQSSLGDNGVKSQAICKELTNSCALGFYMSAEKKKFEEENSEDVSFGIVTQNAVRCTGGGRMSALQLYNGADLEAKKGSNPVPPPANQKCGNNRGSQLASSLDENMRNIMKRCRLPATSTKQILRNSESLEIPRCTLKNYDTGTNKQKTSHAMLCSKNRYDQLMSLQQQSPGACKYHMPGFSETKPRLYAAEPTSSVTGGPYRPRKSSSLISKSPHDSTVLQTQGSMNLLLKKWQLSVVKSNSNN